MSRYHPCFTANGHSIRLLKDRAASLKAERGCTHNEALDEIARSIGYPGWTAVMSEPADADRDEFFGQSLQINDRSRPEYREFLSDRRIEDSPDAFRQFLVDDYTHFKDLGFHRYRLTRECGDPAELIENLGKAVALQGPEALLPQCLSDEYLERLVGHGRLAFAYMGHAKGLPLPPTHNLDPLIYCVIAIAHHQKREKNPRASRFHLKDREMFEATDIYLIRLELEFLSRCTKIKCEQPTLATVLVAPESVSFQLSPE
jgi:hypothetical protein